MGALVDAIGSPRPRALCGRPPAMSSDLFATPEHEIFRDTVRKFVENELAPRAREFDEMGRIDKSLFPKMGELGMLGLRYDPRVGRLRPRLVVHRRDVRGDGALRQRGRRDGHQRAHRHGDAVAARLRQRRAAAKYLVPAIRGEMVGAIAVTEPDAGSDVAAHQDPRGARRRRLGDQRQQDVHHQRRQRRLALRARRDRSRGRLRRLLADHRADRRARLSLRAARQDRQLGLGHRAALLRGRARAGDQHDRRDRPRLPAADDAVPGRAPGRLRQRDRRLASCSGRRRSSTASSACSSASRSARCRSPNSSWSS